MTHRATVRPLEDAIAGEPGHRCLRRSHGMSRRGRRRNSGCLRRSHGLSRRGRRRRKHGLRGRSCSGVVCMGGTGRVASRRGAATNSPIGHHSRTVVISPRVKVGASFPTLTFAGKSTLVGTYLPFAAMVETYTSRATLAAACRSLEKLRNGHL